MALNRKIQLTQIKVASPCSASWEGMTGDQRSRFCQQCEKKVFNISGMSQDEAEHFLNEATGPVCVRLYRRPDGTIITNDCPVGLSAIRMSLAQIATATLALSGMLFCTITFGVFNRNSEKSPSAVEALKDMSLIDPSPNQVPAPFPLSCTTPLIQRAEMGLVAEPPFPPQVIPVIEPPVIEPPVAEPPVAEPPVAEPDAN